jgi:hypothetical protein
MEMRLYKSASTLLLVALLLVGCVGKDNKSANQSEPTEKSSQVNDSVQALNDFQKEINTLRQKLDSKARKVELVSFREKYEEVKKIAPQTNFLEDPVLKSLNLLNELDEDKKTRDKNVEDIQKKIGITEKDIDGFYGNGLRTQLSAYLSDKIKINIDTSNDSPPSIQQENPSPGNPDSLQWLIIPIVIGAILSALSLGTSAFIYSLLKQSNTRLEKLEKKTRDNKDELRKWATNVDKNIKTLSSQQSEMDRKFQQQRQAAKAVEYTNSPQSYGGREQVEYGETFNSPSAQNPYGSSDRQPSSRSDSAQRAYQAPQSPHEIIAQQYNTNPNAIATSAQGVSETEDSIYRRRRDSSIKQVTLQTINNYSYWIISDAEGGYWLTPIAELKLNPMNFDTFQALFQFNGEPLSGKLQLTKPAKVTQASTGQWELIDRGEVQFV